MPDYLLDVELAEIQNVLSAMENKIKYFKANYPYASYEIHNMIICVDALNELIMDLENYNYDLRGEML